MINPQKSPKNRLIHASVLIIFFASGAASLIHEITWTRILRLVMGNTTFSISTVLCVFMGGLALGSYLAGRWVEKRTDSIRAFAILEGLIGIYCLAFPFMLGAIEPIYRWLYQNVGSSFVFGLLQFASSSLLLIIPSAMMGATLPILTNYLARTTHQIGGSAGMLYSINTFGAVLGASATGFILIPNLGVRMTIALGSAINLCACAGGLLLFRFAGRATTATTTIEEQNSDPPKTPKSNQTHGTNKGTASGYASYALIVVLIGYALTGFSSLLYEITWTRVISLMIGSSVYAFTLMLATFIFGLALGSLFSSRFADRLSDPIGVLAVLQIAIGMSALFITPLFEKLPFFVTGMVAQLSNSFIALRSGELLLIAALILIPTTLIGSTFPIAVRTICDFKRRVGASVGSGYSVNSLGSIFGSFAGGFLLIPTFGVQRTMLFAVAVNVAIGCSFLAMSRRLAPMTRLVTASIVILTAVIGILTVKPWDAALMSFGPHVRALNLSAEKARSADILQGILTSGETIYNKEGISATVTVKKKDPGGVLSLYTNGRKEASSKGGGLQQKLLAHLPMLLHENPKRVLLIGLASGVTLNSAGTHDVDVLDCVEISREVTEATRLFAAFNGNILDDERVRVIHTDGRNHLNLSGEKYDVIISQPSDPAVAGVADLFTDEFFTICRKNLTENGKMCAWMKAATVEGETFKSVIHTFGSVFDDISLWNATNFTEYLVVGSKGSINIDHKQFAERISKGRVAADLAKIGQNNLTSLLSCLVMEKDVALSFSDGARLHTDDNSLLEFSAPRSMYRRDRWTDFRYMVQLEPPEFRFLTANANDADAVKALADLKEQTTKKIKTNRPLDMLRHGNELLLDGRFDDASTYYRMCLKLQPDTTEALNNLAWYIAKKQDVAERDTGEAVRLAEHACELTDYSNAHLIDTLSVTYEADGQIGKALESAEKAYDMVKGEKREKTFAENVKRRINALREVARPGP